MSEFRATGIVSVIAVCGALAYLYLQQRYSQIWYESLTGNPPKLGVLHSPIRLFLCGHTSLLRARNRTRNPEA
ncbi:MAG: hypothetical protein Q6366_007325 [Candidatus Freyarchaeota archaeon]